MIFSRSLRSTEGYQVGMLADDGTIEIATFTVKGHDVNHLTTPGQLILTNDVQQFFE